MSKRTGSETASGTIDPPAAQPGSSESIQNPSTGTDLSKENPTSEDAPADVSAEKRKERSLPGPRCPNCAKTNTRVVRTKRELVDDHAYPDFLKKKREVVVRYYKCADCDENFKN